tara:strand:- start:239 stop:493 length:255 start_codon:yes stop_codon:yes gene_type:complete
VNKQIELVERWFADPSSVSQLELETSALAAAIADTYADNDTYAATYAAENASYYASLATANCTHATAAAEWVAKYHELIKEPTL